MGATYAWGVDSMNQSFLVDKVRSGSVVYDVGANRGQMALYFSRLVGPSGKVFSFEPAPDNFALLERNLSLNASASNVKPFQLALAADNHSREFTFHETDHTQGTFSDRITLLDSWDTLIKVQVQCDTIDHLIEAGMPKPDLLKVDVEGAGEEVLQGAVKTLVDHRPAIYMEIHATSPEAPEWVVFQRLQSEFGYTAHIIGGLLNANSFPIWGAAVWFECPR
jgi:FkbM family methyltransferase